MTDFYYDGTVVLTASYDAGPRSSVWLKWMEGEGDLASLLVEMLGIDEESLATEGVGVELHARVHITLDPHRARLRGES